MSLMQGTEEVINLSGTKSSQNSKTEILFITFFFKFLSIYAQLLIIQLLTTHLTSIKTHQSQDNRLIKLMKS